jgi:deazaflavin-dependent oxidoreductase (nitroreductase family)
MSPTERAVARVVIKWSSRANALVYRLSGGRVGAKFMGGEDLLLLTTKGRASGLPRTAPLIYLRDGDALVVVASKGGWPEHPLWYGNLVAEPSVEVQVGGVSERRTARTAEGDERARLWERLVKLYPPYEPGGTWSLRGCLAAGTPARSSAWRRVPPWPR